jgi:uncharacterized protein YegL
VVHCATDFHFLMCVSFTIAGITMPKIGESSVQNSVGFSKQRLSDFHASEYTLVDINVDCSGTMSGFESAVEAAVQNIIESCRKSPRAGNLLIRISTFGSSIHQVHDFKLLKEILPSEYAGAFKAGGMTCLRDAGLEMFLGIRNNAKSLRDHDYEVNAIGFIITDGEDTCSTSGPNAVADACQELVLSEVVDSYRSIVISINNSTDRFRAAMEEFARTCGFDQVVDAGQADPKSLAKLAEFVSQSISSQSSALGTGAPSQPVTF